MCASEKYVKIDLDNRQWLKTIEYIYIYVNQIIFVGNGSPSTEFGFFCIC